MPEAGISIFPTTTAVTGLVPAGAYLIAATAGSPICLYKPVEGVFTLA